MDAYIKGMIEALKKQDFKSASDSLEKLREVVPESMKKGYISALTGIVSAVQSNDPNSLIVKAMKGEMLKKDLEVIRKDFKSYSENIFRMSEERSYSRAWYDILSIMLDKRKVGLEKHIK